MPNKREKKGKEAPVMISTGDDSINYFVGNPRLPHGCCVKVGQGTARAGTQRGVLHVLSEPSHVVCVQNIPNFITPSDFVQHVAPSVQHFRRVKMIGCSYNSAQYMLIIHLDSAESAASFRQNYNAKPMSVLGPEVLFIQFVTGDSVSPRCSGFSMTSPRSVSPHPDTSSLPQAASSDMTSPDDRLEQRASDLSCAFEARGEANDVIVCPVCLEELGGADEVLCGGKAPWMTLCGHSAHLECLERCDDNSGCPVCRFNLQDLGMECSVEGCEVVDPLWMCLCCGNLGCGRYAKGHAEQHYRETAHTYCIEVYSGAVWDYTGDGFVHRLIMNRTDGKIVEAGGSATRSGLRSAAEEVQLDLEDAKFESRVECISNEFSQLLEEQLDSQRAYFEKLMEKRLEEHEEKMNGLLGRVAEKEAELQRARAHTAATVKQTGKLRQRATDARAKKEKLEEELQLDRHAVEQLRKMVPLFRKKRCELVEENPPTENPEAKALREKIQQLMKELD